MEKKLYQATGRRKESTASVYLKGGTGKITINDKPMEEYFPRESLRITVKHPLVLTSSENSYDIKAKIVGGGVTGQVDSLKLAIARALIKVNPKFRPILKKEGLLKRDPRMVERKKYGQPKARKRFQFSKR
ncbi:MAG: 30S ribosomal protein S9 [Spirochaetes bacterium]|nr:30S ribosomal protein S9 [Spirochaetota bacterium]